MSCLLKAAIIFTLPWTVTSLGHVARVACMTLLLRHSLLLVNMAERETNVEQRNAIKFMFKEGESASNVYIRLQNVYGEHCMSRTRVFEWFKRFKTGRTSIDNEPRSGRPATAVNEQTIAQIDKLIRGDRRLRVKDIMAAVNIGAHAADEIIHERLRFNKVCARWVPRHLTDDNKEMRFSICQDLFERYDKEGEQFQLVMRPGYISLNQRINSSACSGDMSSHRHRESLRPSSR